jgi:hypothetical protein
MEPGSVVAKQGDDIFLIYDGDQDGVPYGHMVDDSSGYTSESMPLDQFLKQGYWEDVGSEDEEIV